MAEPVPHHPPHSHHPPSPKSGEHRQTVHRHAAAPEHAAGVDKHAGHSVAMFRTRFWVALLLSLPTLVWGHMLPRLLGYSAPAFPGSHLIAPVFGIAVFLVGGGPFLQGAVRELRARLPGMMTLIAIAITAAFVYSVAITLGFPGIPLWEELATLVTIMLLGHWIEMRSIARARGALSELAELLPDVATRIVEGTGAERLEEVAVASLVEGDLVLIRPGASIPADGEVADGSSTVDEAMITGESRPVGKKPHDRVIAGTINQSGSLRVLVTGIGERTALAGIMRLVEAAQQSRSRAQVLADRAAFWLTLIALGTGTVSLLAWLSAGSDTAFAVERFVTVLVIACPHALGLAVPLVIAISTTLGARNGLLVRDRRGLEEARHLSVVVFDKTGTLTLGEHRVVALRTTGSLSERDALALAAAVERDAEHPVARALVRSAEERGLAPVEVESFRSIPGQGTEATVRGRVLRVGGPNMLADLGLTPDHALQDFAGVAARTGESVVFLIEGSEILAAFALADAVRPESQEAIEQLHQQRLEVAMVTGDSRAVAEKVARQLGIDRVFAEVLPDGKVARIEALQQEGKRVAMVGDGVNDAPALAMADVGIAVGAGTDVAVEAGDVVLVRSDPRDIPRIIALSRATYRKMVQNLWWATGYNIIAIPLAAGLLARAGIVLSPAMGAVLMSLSTVIVAINAQLLRRVKL